MRGITNYEDQRWKKYLDAQIDEKDRSAWKKILETEEGRWIFSRILQMTQWEAPSFTGNSQTFYNEGKRAIGIEITKRLAALHGHDSLIWRQQAEKEFVEFQEMQNRFFRKGD